MLETMPEKLVAYGEEKGRKEGAKKTILRVLQARLGEVPQEIKDQINSVKSAEILDRLAERAALVQSLDEFRASVTEIVDTE